MKCVCGHKRKRHGPGQKTACWKGDCECEEFDSITAGEGES